jgi:hypothetical protein
MSTLKVDTITDAAGSGAPDFPNGMTGNGSSLTGLATEAQGDLADTALQSSSSLAAANLTGALPAIDGSALTGVGSSTTLGAVGTYALLRVYQNNTAIQDPSDTLGGSDLRYSPASGDSENSSPVPSGTWQVMGRSRGSNYGESSSAVSLWVRIS